MDLKWLLAMPWLRVFTELSFMYPVWRDGCVSAKRKCTSNVKFFKTIIADRYNRHLEQQHDSERAEHQHYLTTEGKKVLFYWVAVPFVNTIAAHGYIKSLLQLGITGS